MKDKLYFRNGGDLAKLPTILLSFLLINLFISCNHTASFSTPGIPYTRYLTDSIEFSCQAGIENSVIYGFDKKGNMYFYGDNVHQRIICFNGKGFSLDTIPYPSATREMLHGFYAITSDSFAFLLHNTLFLYGVRSKTLKTYNLDSHGIRYEAITNQAPLEIVDSLAFFYNFEDTMAINTQQNWELNMKLAHVESIFNLDKGKMEDIKIGRYPKEIYDSNNCYYSFSPARCINYEEHELVYLYRQSNMLYIFNYLTKVLRTIPIQNPDFIANQKFDMNQIMNFNYISKYETENSRNVAIIYNKFRNEYYVKFSPKYSYEVPNSDEVIKPFDKPWSILVLDSNFAIKLKIDFPAKKYYFAGIVLQKGLLVGYWSNYRNHSSSANSFKYAAIEF